MMRPIGIFIIAVLVSWSAAAEESVWQILQRVSAYMDSEVGYEAQFEIKAVGYASKGSYCVKGDSYYINITDAEVYSDGDVRYEVDNIRKEVNIDQMDYASRNILDNPTRCFDFVEEDYSAEVISRADKSVTIKLQAKDVAIEGEIYITIIVATGAPTKLEYKLYDEKVEVNVISIDHQAKGVKEFKRSAYQDYEIIDFR